MERASLPDLQYSRAEWREVASAGMLLNNGRACKEISGFQNVVSLN